MTSPTIQAWNPGTSDGSPTSIGILPRAPALARARLAFRSALFVINFS